MDTGKQKNLLAYMPVYYTGNYIMRDIQNSVSLEIDRLDQSLTDTLKQLFVSTATWGLKLWETELGINIDPTKPEETRRNSILGKIRGVGITTPKAIKGLAELFSGGEVNVIELFDKYRFVIKFIGTRGIPANLKDLSQAIEEIKPAHLAFGYEFTYLVWAEAATFLWFEAGKFTWDQFRVQKPLDVNRLTTWGMVFYMDQLRYWNSLKNFTWEKLKLYKRSGGI
jgi:hypothetical protein